MKFERTQRSVKIHDSGFFADKLDNKLIYAELDSNKDVAFGLIFVNYCIFLQELRVRTRPKREFGSRKRPPLIRKGQKGDYVELLIESHFGEEECWLREEWGGVGQKERARRRRHRADIEGGIARIGAQ